MSWSDTLLVAKIDNAPGQAQTPRDPALIPNRFMKGLGSGRAGALMLSELPRYRQNSSMNSPLRVSVVLPVYKDEATVREVVTRARHAWLLRR